MNKNQICPIEHLRITDKWTGLATIGKRCSSPDEHYRFRSQKTGKETEVRGSEGFAAFHKISRQAAYYTLAKKPAEYKGYWITYLGVY